MATKRLTKKDKIKIVDLCQTLLKNLSLLTSEDWWSNVSGLCELTWEIGNITGKQRALLKRILPKIKPGDKYYPYCWKPGAVAPRKRWLKETINKYS